MARTFNTKLNKSYKSEHPCLIHDLKENAFSFPLMSLMLAVSLSYMAFIMLRYVPSVPTATFFFIIMGAEFCQMLCLHLLILSYNFILYSVYMVYQLIDL